MVFRSLNRSLGSMKLILSRRQPNRGRLFSVNTPVPSVNELFEYTSGRWLINEALRLSERKRVFNVDGLRRLAAQSVQRTPEDIASFVKLAEGGFNRIFLITMKDGFQMVARIPYPVTIPKYLSVASEVATMDFLRYSGMPVPEVYGYSPSPDNDADTEYIFMEFLSGTKLSDIWFELEEKEVTSVMKHLVQLESKMMKIAFPAGGSLYYSKDIDKVTKWRGIPLNDGRFCVGPDTRIAMWSGRRGQLEVERGPYTTTTATLEAAADKELAYLKQFGRPLYPFDRARRDVYDYEKQTPVDHIENLNRFRLIASELVPEDPALSQFCIRHLDLQPGNIMVSKSLDSKLNITGLIDWQHTSILPVFLLSHMPYDFQNYGDTASESIDTPPPPPDLSSDLVEFEKELYRRRLVHYQYLNETRNLNPILYEAMTTPMGVLRSRLFTHARDPWEGESINLKVDLIDAFKKWESLTGGKVPCPFSFDAEDIQKTREMDAALKETDEATLGIDHLIGVSGPELWLPSEKYDGAMEMEKTVRENMYKLAVNAPGSDLRVEKYMEHWPYDDFDEEEYM